MKKSLISLLMICFLFACSNTSLLDSNSVQVAKQTNKSQQLDNGRATNVAQNGTMMQYFHWYTPAGGTHWNTVKNNASKLAEMGVTALWLPPAYKGSGGYDVGYGVYDMYDLGEFDQKGTVATKYGTKDQYLAAINACHNNGINIYADVVFNHRGGADYTEWFNAVRCDKGNRNYEYGGVVNIEGWTGFNFAGRNNKYSDFKWHWYHFDGVDWAQNLGDDSIFRIVSDGKGWDWEVDGENGNYDYLMYADLDMNHPDVVQELKNWAVWYVNFANLDGFRMDAVKHIKYGFFNDWLNYVRSKTGKELFTVGEFWNYDIGKLNHFIDSTGGCMSLFDAPMHMNFYQASKSGGSYDMGSIFNGTLTQANPLKSVSIVENHDTQPCQALESCVDWWFKPLAYALILLRQEAYPCVFYADLYGAEYDDCGYHINMAPVENLDKLIKARKLYAYGTQRNYLDSNNIIGWTREGVDGMPNSGCAVIMSDGAGGSKWMEVGKKFAGKQFYDYLGIQQNPVTINADGWGEFWCDGGKVSVYVPKADNSVISQIGFETADGFASKSKGTYTISAKDGSWNLSAAAISTGAKINGTYGASLPAKSSYIQTPIYTNPKTLKFNAKASGTTSNFTIDVEYSQNGTSWTKGASFVANGKNTGDIKSTASELVAYLNLTGKYYIRWNMSVRSSGSFYFDDVYVSNVKTGTATTTTTTTSTTTTTTTTTTTVAAVSSINCGFESADGFATKSKGTYTIGNWYLYASAINSSAKINGSLGASIAAKDSYIRTPLVKNPKSITFNAKASGTTANFTIGVQYSKDGVSWTSAKTFAANGSNSGAIKSTKVACSVSVSLTGNYYVRFIMTARSSGTFYFDDVVISSTATTSTTTTTTTTTVASSTNLLSCGFEKSADYSSWTLSGSVSTGAKISGSYGLTLNAKDKYAKTPILKNPKTLTFACKASGTTSKYTVNVEYSKDGSSWTTAKSLATNGSDSGTVTTTAKTNTISLNLTGSYYIRWYVSARSSGSFYLDDVVVK